MSLCTACHIVICEIFAQVFSNRTGTWNNTSHAQASGLFSETEGRGTWERSYRFPSSSDCGMCYLMQSDIYADRLHNGFAHIKFEASSTILQGTINKMVAFSFPVYVDNLDSFYQSSENEDVYPLLQEVPAYSQYRVSKKSWVPKKEKHRSQNAMQFGWAEARVVSAPSTPSRAQTAVPLSRLEGRSSQMARANLAKMWIDTCHAQHDSCKPHQPFHFLPTRLIDVKESRLIETRQHTGPPLQYIAFTHCWGPQMPKAAMTHEATLPILKNLIDISTLPKSFRDAVLVTKLLGARYIWIDSLCIIQDSLEDWEAESAQMGMIYSYAWCTVAASGAASCHEGMDLFRKDSETSCALVLQDTTNRHVQICISKTPASWDKFHQTNPLNKRGWTFQERELSPRVLHFTADQIWWECRSTREQQDLVPEAIPLSKKQQQKKDKKVVRENIKNAVVYSSPPVSSEARLRCMDNMLVSKEQANHGTLQAEHTSLLLRVLVTEARYNTWHTVIEDYSARTFSKITDRFPALSGLASAIQQMHGGEYVAGAWHEDLLRSLLWRRRLHSTSTLHVSYPRQVEYCAPSWSWAAIDEAVTYDLVCLHRSQIDQSASTTAHIEAVNLFPLGSDPKGRLKSGHMLISGKLKMSNPSTNPIGIKLHLDFDLDADPDERISTAPVFMLSLFASSSVLVTQHVLFGPSIVAWALALIMVEEVPEPVFRRVGVVSEVPSAWFDDAFNVRMKIM